MKKSSLLLTVALACLTWSCEGPGVENVQKENGYAYVDLGLSCCWATCNIGAAAPEQVGTYFAWGETKEKAIYDWDSYKYGEGSNALTKYCTLAENGKNGFVDNLPTLTSADDAANVLWGGKWRIPQPTELRELLEKCTWEYVETSEVKGYNVTGPNGNYIFLPCSGYMKGSEKKEAESIHCWGNAISKSKPQYAACLRASLDEDPLLGTTLRDLGATIRPVFVK